MADLPRRFVPSAEDWIEYWPRIMDLFKHGDPGGNMTVPALARRMKEDWGFTASNRMYYGHFKKAGISINIVAEKRTPLKEELLRKYQDSQTLSDDDIDKLRKVIRHHPKDTPEALNDREMLKLIEKSLTRPVGSSRVVNHAASVSSIVDDAVADDFVEGNNTLQSGSEEASNLQPSPADLVTWLQSFSQRPSGVRDPTFVSGPRRRDQPYRVLDPASEHDFGPDLERLISRTQVYYTARLRSHSTTNVAEQSRFHDFWTRVKTVIYLYKDGGSDRASPMVLELLKLIPDICSMQNLSLLRELFSTLSRANTDIFPGLRKLLLEWFVKSLKQIDNIDDELITIYNTLLQDWVRDRHLVTMLTVLIRITKDNADALHPELAQLYRSRVALLRRMHDLPNARECAIDAREVIEPLHGPNCEFTRLILSEQVYVLSARKNFKEALELAKDVVRRAQLDEKDMYPSQRSIYHLEDVADIQKKMKKYDQASASMEYALSHAHGEGSHEEAAMHLEDKLDEVRTQMQDMRLSVTQCQQSRP